MLSYQLPTGQKKVLAMNISCAPRRSTNDQPLILIVKPNKWQTSVRKITREHKCIIMEFSPLLLSERNMLFAML